MDSETQDSAAQRLELAAKILSLAYGLISILWLLWILIPEHQRRLIAMRGVKTVERSAWRGASRAGRQEMALELRGCATSYGVPYGLAQLALRAERLYERMRYSA